MSFQTSFKQILREKMGETPLNSGNYSSVMDSDPIHMAYLLGRVNKTELQTPRGQYPRPAVRPQRKPHNFSPAQRQSFEFFKCWIHGLAEGFTETELRKAFRQAALILHPDHGGNTQQFMDLKEHFEVLRGVFQS
ncbi:J domain-containing protein [Bdellovibrio sp. SKB1291214]|uniref:J domain-containing protein n=1 Tax=Bdellovibrio sp. SKB1291214 TaxID=1732569 RepID=UPI000B51A467|nr:J domain-containing protein [Bdellovibrio sp. SKB1291214]UYL09358.1 J domain-containing protein [Bdellovibrio sp. SKB1291214]